MTRTTTRRRLIGGACAFVLAAIGARTWHINANAQEKPQVISHKMGEWVELDGAFLMDRADEQTEGYAVRVTEAEHLSYNEYIECYATDGSQPIEGLDAQSLVCLTLQIRNEQSSGGLGIAMMYLVPDRKNEFLVVDSDLLLAAETKLRESGANLVTGVSIRPGSEYEVRLAYHRQGGTTQLGDREVNEAYLETIRDDSFELVLSNLPARHVVRVTT